MLTRRITTFRYGTINSVDKDTTPSGAAIDSLNWLTRGDKIELRRGFKFMGSSSRNEGLGRATGIIKIVDAVGVDQLFGTYGKKLKHWNRTTEEWEENGSDLLGAAVLQADGFGENISMCEYVGLAGYQLWINSPNCAGFFKVMVANPTSNADQYNASKNYKGYISIDTNRTFLWARKEDKTGLNGSYIDTQAYTTETAEVLGAGDGVLLTFTGTLAFKAGGSRRTCFAVVVTGTTSSGVETFTDNFNGVLTGSLGGTGTINYTTGAISVTFFAAVNNSTNVTVTYQWEDANAAGIADFTESATRLAGQGFVFRQDEGGGQLQAVKNFKNIYYCFHVKKTWALNLSDDDTNASNLPYRTLVGLPSLRAAVETEDGIYYVDTSGKEPKIKILTYSSVGSEEVLPANISDQFDLSGFEFDRCSTRRFQDMILFSCRLDGSTYNDRTIVYNRIWKSFDILDYAVNDWDDFDGALVAADSLSDNFTELFSGLSDDDANIRNYWISDLDDLEIEGLKKTKKWYQRGQIGVDQIIKISLSFDGGAFVEVGEISGSGSYVDRTQAVSVGAYTLGRGEIGGGGDGIEAFEYERLFPIRTSRFERCSVKFEATEIGYASVSEYGHWDVRRKEQTVPMRYRG